MTIPSFEGAGLPQDRLAKLAARRAFVELKQDFMIATAGLPGHRGDWLRERVRKSEDPYDLWQLRQSLFAALAGNDPDTCTIRHALKTGLDSLFTESDAGPVSSSEIPLHATSPGALPARMPSAGAIRAAARAAARMDSY
ncbi:MAG: hypothetical protein JNJ71_20190 [Rubrivivax sp.]|nr:hypothetical protein [Rubrivivax sp.]